MDEYFRGAAGVKRSSEIGPSTTWNRGGCLVGVGAVGAVGAVGFKAFGGGLGGARKGVWRPPIARKSP